MNNQVEFEAFQEVTALSMTQKVKLSGEKVGEVTIEGLTLQVVRIQSMTFAVLQGLGVWVRQHQAVYRTDFAEVVREKSFKVITFLTRNLGIPNPYKQEGEEDHQPEVSIR